MKTTRMFWSMLAMVSMLFATSCSQNELEDNSVDSGNYVSASFALSSPEGGLDSRTIGDGTKVDKVVCAIFDEKGAEMTELRQILPFETQTAKYSVRLAKGQNYRAVFFAYHAAEGTDMPEYYDIENLKEIEILDAVSNIEERDAFTAYEMIGEGATMQPIERNVILYRPFAQLNLGSLEADWTAAKKAGVEIANTKITVSNVYTVFSAYDDKVEGETQKVTFGLNAIPTEALQADVDGDGQDEAYQYLALNYLLVGDKANEKNLTDITFVWENADGSKTNSPVTEFKNIPVQRNYRTNIIGWLLTNPADFNITIDERFEKPDYIISYLDPVIVYNWDEFNTAVSEIVSTNGYRDIKLGADITYDQDYALNKNVDLDLNGFSLEISNSAKSLNISSNVSIKNGTIKGKVMAQSGSKITLEGVTFGGEIDGLVAEASLHIKDGSDVYVKNCTFDAKDASSGPKSRPLSIDEASSGTFKFEGCIFLGEHTYNNVYVDPLNGTATLDFTNCTFNSCTLYVNFAATCSLTNLTMSGNTLPGQPTFDIKRAKGDVTAAEWAHLKKLIKDSNNSLNQCIRIHYTNNVTETYFGN